MHTPIPGKYEHSGGLGMAPFVVPIGGIVAAIIFSIIYSYMIVYTPIAGYISILFIGGLVFALVWSVSKLGYSSHCRNPRYLHLVGLVVGLVALYASWATFVYALLARYDEDFDASLLEVFLSPVGVWELAKLINVDGWYSIFNVTPKGIGLWIIWGFEALLIVGGTSLLAAVELQEAAYCEDCGQWCKYTKDVAHFAVPEDPAALTELEADHLQPLLSQPSVDPAAADYLIVASWHCNECHSTSAMQVKARTLAVDDEGNQSEKFSDLTEIWSVPSEVLKEVIQVGNRSKPDPA